MLTEFGHDRRRETLSLAIGGGAGFPRDAEAAARALVERYGISPSRAAHLVDLYGTRAKDVLKFCACRDDDKPLVAGTEVTAAEIAFIARNEFVQSLADVLLRRTPLSIRGDVSIALVAHVATVLAAELGWSTDRTQQEVESFIADLSDYHGVSREALERRSSKGS